MQKHSEDFARVLGFIEEQETANDRRVACNLLGQEYPQYYDFLRNRSHLVARGAARTVLQEALWQLPNETVRQAADEYLLAHPERRPRLKPLARTRPPVVFDPCDSTFETDHPDLCAAYSPDGRKILMHSAGILADEWLAPEWPPALDRFAALLLEWEVSTGALLRVVGAGQFRENESVVAVSPGNGWVAVRNHRSVEIRAGESLDFARILEGTEGPSALVFLDEDHLAVLDGSTLQLWDLSGGDRTPVKNIETIGTRGLAYDPAGNLLAVGAGIMAEVAMHSPASGELVRTYGEYVDRPVERFYAVCFDPDGQNFYLGGRDRSIRMRNLERGTDTILGNHADELEKLLFIRDSGCLAAGGFEGRIEIFDVAGRERVAHFQAHVGYLQSLELDAASGRLLSAGSDGTARVWRTLKEILDVQPNASPTPPFRIRNLAEARLRFDRVTGQILVCADDQNCAWSLKDDRISLAEPRSKGAAPGGPELTWNRRNEVLEFEVGHGRGRSQFRIVIPENPGPGGCAFDPGSGLLAIAGCEKRVLSLYASESGRLIEEWQLDDILAVIEFTSDETGTLLVGLDLAGHVCVWEALDL